MTNAPVRWHHSLPPAPTSDASARPALVASAIPRFTGQRLRLTKADTPDRKALLHDSPLIGTRGPTNASGHLCLVISHPHRLVPPPSPPQPLGLARDQVAPTTNGQRHLWSLFASSRHFGGILKRLQFQGESFCHNFSPLATPHF